MIFDAKVPESLKREQQWFGSILSSPIDEKSFMNPISPSGNPIEIEAAEHILPSPTLQPAQRIQIYNQQYWWRLLNILQEAFPMATRLTGYAAFNRILAIPYLVKYPPRHWSLNLLGKDLAEWTKSDYRGPNQALMAQCVALDWAFVHSFIVETLPPLTAEQAQDEEFVSRKLYAQPYLFLFQWDMHLFNFREELLKHDPDYWQKHPKPTIDQEKTYHFVLYRNQNNEISWKEISYEEYFMLNLFKSGSSIEEACEKLEKQSKAFESAISHLQQWFQEWTARGWLSLR